MLQDGKKSMSITNLCNEDWFVEVEYSLSSMLEN